MEAARTYIKNPFQELAKTLSPSNGHHGNLIFPYQKSGK